MAVTRVSTTSTGQQADGDSFLAYPDYNSFGSVAPGAETVFSPDGKTVVFATDAANLTSTMGGIVTKNTVTGVTTVQASDLQSPSDAQFSSDGNAIVFDAVDSNGNVQVYETTLATGTTAQVSNLGANASVSAIAGVSPDGSKVAFAADTQTSDPSTGSTMYAPGLFVANAATGQAVQIGDANSYGNGVFTPDLREALYTSEPTSSADSQQLYVEDTTTGVKTLVSSAASGAAGNGTSDIGFIAATGDQVVFRSDSTNLAAGASQGGIFVKNLVTQGVGVVATNQSSSQVLSANSIEAKGVYQDLQAASVDGTKVAYVTQTYDVTSSRNPTTNAGTRNATEADRIEIKDLRTGTVTDASPIANNSTVFQDDGAGGFSETTNGTSYTDITFSADGSQIAYVAHTASNETMSTGPTGSSGSGSETAQVFVYNIAKGTTTAVSDVQTSNASNPVGFSALTFSPDGSKIAFDDSTFNTRYQFNTVVTDIASGTRTVIETPDSGVFFSPDSSSVAFTSAGSLVSDDTNNSDDVFIEPVCYASGTLILTEAGEVAVEHLRVGDVVVTASGDHRPIVWLGRRTIDCVHHREPQAVLPVRVRANAFKPNVPASDLWLSPGHAVCIDMIGEVLLPIAALINDATIVQETVEAVTYWHVELESHDLLVANGMAAESYIDVGNRAFFQDGSGTPDGVAGTLADYCRPLLTDETAIAILRSRLTTRAMQLGWMLDGACDPDLHLVVDGAILRPLVENGVARVAMPAHARAAWLVSRHFVPMHVGHSSDSRRLGVRLTSVSIDDGLSPRSVVAASDPRLATGFHEVEHEGEVAWRWTKGCALLPAALWAERGRPFILQLALEVGPITGWVKPEGLVEPPFATSAWASVRVIDTAA